MHYLLTIFAQLWWTLLSRQLMETFMTWNATATEKSAWGYLLKSEFLPRVRSDVKTAWLRTASQINKVKLLAFKRVVLCIQVFALDQPTCRHVRLLNRKHWPNKSAVWERKHTSLIRVSRVHPHQFHITEVIFEHFFASSSVLRRNAACFIFAFLFCFVSNRSA